MVRVLNIALGALLAVASIAAAVTVEEAQAYDFQFVIDDPEGDNNGVLVLPGDTSPEADIVGVDVTDDADTLIVRVRMATLDFLIPGVASVSVASTGPNGEDWDMQGTWSSGGADPGVGDSDPSTGDPDELIPGVTIEASPDESAMYFFVDKAAAGLGLGSTWTIDGVSSGRGVSAVATTLTFVNLDTVEDAVLSVPINSFATGGGVVAPTISRATHYLELVDDLDLAFEAEVPLDENGNATGPAMGTYDTYVYNWTTDQTEVPFSFDLMPTGGAVNITLTDPDDLVVYGQVHDGAASFDDTVTAFIDGQWSLAFAFDNFTGTVEASVAPVVVHEEEAEPDEPIEVENFEPSGGFQLEEEGHALPGPGLLLAGLAVAFVARRQR